MQAKKTVMANTYTNGLLDPRKPMLGPVMDGGHIVVNTAAGCWGPMITPELQGGHEVSQPVYVEGAEPGDAIVIRIESVNITSKATASGNDEPQQGRFVSDSFVDKVCPHCGAKNPKSYIEGVGENAVRCAECGAPVAPFHFTNGYTIAFDGKHQVGLTLNKEAAEKVGADPKTYMQTPDNSVQNPIVCMAPHDLVGVATRCRTFIGQLGTTPKSTFPDSHNAGDFGQALIGATHSYAKTQETLADKTDGHMDINKVRPGAVVIAPVKVKGAGVYVGDVHAMQGEGEIAGHTTDVCAEVSIQVSVLKGLDIDGPIILPNIDDVPRLAQPLTVDERLVLDHLADEFDQPGYEESAPVSFVGTGATLNDAVNNGMERCGKLFGMTIPEVMNRVTITGAIEIGRAPGVVSVSLRVPKERLAEKGLWDLVNEQYHME